VTHAWWTYPALAAVGVVAGTLNVVAGGGSFLTLPAMIFLGLPPTVANGTNRIAILVQNAGAVWGFHRRRLVTWRWLLRVILPAAAGAVVGAWLAVRIGDQSFKRILSVFMVVVSLASLWRPSARETPDPPGVPERLGARIALGAAFFLVGAYGGFVQAGTGFLFLAVLAWAGFDLVRGNAMKVLAILLWTPLALWQFAAGGQVEWLVGVALAAGNLSGAVIGVRLTVLRGSRWVRRVVTVTVIGFAVALWLMP
jgi:uncharacterized membrane protein YfcA